MKILVIGDTHGKLNKARDVISRLKGLDLIIHTGDYITDGEILENETKIPVVRVKGNCDGSMSQNDYEIVDTEYGKIFVVHGHMHQNPDNLYYAAKEHGCIAAITGHTHVPVYEQEDDMYILNPGSLSRPRDGSNGSYIVLTATESTFGASVLYYNDGPSGVKGGFIKSILNYSDRF